MRDLTGRLLGTHDGLANFTIGQRHGLGIAVGTPMYVVRLDAQTNTVTLAPREALLSAGLIADQVNWLADPPPAGQVRPAAVQIRYTHPAAAGRIRRRADGSIEARFAELQPAVTPGQAAVLYEEDVVLGGGWIREALPPVAGPDD